MSARSVAELLPKPFAELDLDDVAEVMRRVGEERESLFFERKAVAKRDLLAKSCSAFANTMGGLLVFGIPDDSDELVGIDNKICPTRGGGARELRGLRGSGLRRRC